MRRPTLHAVILLAALAYPSASALARDLYVAPTGTEATASEDGSREAPFSSLAAALDHTASGREDRILLMDGEHGEMRVVQRHFEPPLVIEAEHEGRAYVSTLSVGKASGLVVRGLGVWPTEPGDGKRSLVNISGRGVRLERLDIRGRPDAPESYLDWTAADWKHDWRAKGVTLWGQGNAIVDSRLTGVSFGITANGPDMLVQGNHILGFSGDALRGLGDGGRFVGNRVENCVRIDANHMDAFQSWSSRKEKGKPVRDLLIEANTVLEWTGPASHPYRCRLQGISLFDGPFENVTISNNLVTSSAYHGIALFKASNSRILNNTVVRPDGKPGGAPWVSLSEGTADGVEVANNVGMAFRNIPNALRRNVVAKVPGQVFTDPARQDFTPRPGGPLIGTGDTALAPARDILGQPRTPARADIGAFQGS
ncbi:right-handed parallel beta-helix repeat-containing protein [Frigidibacter sp. MR17.14]|uniref:right-handed parallel beta-helix repeat-containing protein n=1 Tax=Frigidibacter sp. MR17.14 TaxID=3126509 RepID=UPI003012EA24